MGHSWPGKCPAYRFRHWASCTAVAGSGPSSGWRGVDWAYLWWGDQPLPSAPWTDGWWVGGDAWASLYVELTGSSLERSPGGDGLLASGYPFTWLCTEKPWAGIQERGIQPVCEYAGYYQVWRGDGFIPCPCSDRWRTGWVRGSTAASGRINASFFWTWWRWWLNRRSDRFWRTRPFIGKCPVRSSRKP